MHKVPRINLTGDHFFAITFCYHFGKHFMSVMSILSTYF